MGQLLRDEVAPGERIGREACVDRLVHRRVRLVDSSQLRTLERDLRGHPHRGVEEHEPSDPLRLAGGELQSEPSAEAVTDHVDVFEMQRVERVDEIVGVRAEVPRRLPVGDSVATQIGRETWNAPSRSWASLRKRPPQLVTPWRQRTGGAPAGPQSCTWSRMRRNYRSVLAVLYDIHGNLPALEAVLADARARGATAFFLGGDLVGFGPFPQETYALLREIEEPAVWIRGNGERWLRAADRPRGDLRTRQGAGAQVAGRHGRIAVPPSGPRGDRRRRLRARLLLERRRQFRA